MLRRNARALPIIGFCILSGCGLVGDPLPDDLYRMGLSRNGSAVVIDTYQCAGGSLDLTVYRVDSPSQRIRDGEPVFRSDDELEVAGWTEDVIGPGSAESGDGESDGVVFDASSYYVVRLANSSEQIDLVSDPVKLDDLPEWPDVVRRQASAGEVSREDFRADAPARC